MQEVLLNLNPKNRFMLTSEDGLGTPKTGDTVFTVMTYGFGRGDGKHFSQSRRFRELTLTDKQINGPKGTLFEGNNVRVDRIGKVGLQAGFLLVRKVSLHEYPWLAFGFTLARYQLLTRTKR